MSATFLVWSLREMMQKLEAERLLSAASFLSSTSKRFDMLAAEMDRTGQDLYKLQKQHEIVEPCAAAMVIVNFGKALGSAAIIRAGGEFGERMKKALDHPHNAMLAYELRAAVGCMQQLIGAAGAELDARQLFVIGPKYADLFTNQFVFGQSFADLLPDASYDAEEVGKCMALARWTAAVFHMMRAVELAAQHLARKVGATHADKHGETLALGVLTANIGAKVDAMPKGKEQDNWQKAKLLLHSCNRAYRTKTAHPAAKYTEPEAESALQVTRSFMQVVEELS